MSKDEVIYELIDKYAYFACIANIIIENYTMSDGEETYQLMMQTFGSYLNHYKKIEQDVEAGRLDESAADAMIKTDINWLRQKSFKGFASALQKCVRDEFNPEMPYDVEYGLQSILEGKPGYDVNDADLQSLLASIRIAEEECRAARWKEEKE